MKQIIELFKTPEQVQRTIQKVIEYAHNSADDLKREVDEYVVTDHIRDSLDHLLDWIDKVADTPGLETGAWVSGFYGSGKSSFSKYIGYSFDRSVQIDEKPFVERFASRIDAVTTEQRLKTLAKKLDAAVIMLDLASQGYGTKIEDVSEILYLHTLKKLGYCSQSLPLANLEIMLEEEGRYQEFCNRIKEKFGKNWEEEHNRVMLSKGHAKAVIAEMFPGQPIDLEEKGNTVTMMDCKERAEKAVQLIRRKTGKKYIFFVVDEVGQYLAPRPKQILDMDGLAKNLRTVGEGKVFIIGTAQQTLTEDSKVAAINSQELYKLKDRFPESVTLESSDIEKICMKRLLGKCADGVAELQNLFDQHGARFVTTTQLRNCPDYETGLLKKERFAELYPFTPTHFQLLLSLLSELSRTTGGIGLRSAIKVVQDVLIHGRSCARLVDAPIGRLVTAMDFYDELRLDIEHSHEQLTRAVKKTLDWCGRQGDSAEFYSAVAKTLAVTSLLKNFVATPFNVAALMQQDLASPVTEKQVADALSLMEATDAVPVNEDGNESYVYLSDKLVTLDEERKRFQPYQANATNLVNELIKDIFAPVGNILTANGLSVRVSLWMKDGQAALTNGGGALQQDVVLYDAGQREEFLREALSESRQSQNKLIFLAQRPADWQEKVADILRSQHMAESYMQDTESEIRDYAKSQLTKSDRDRGVLKQEFIQAFNRGELVTSGRSTAVKETFEPMLREELKALANITFSKHYLVGKKSAQSDTAHRFLQSTPGVQSDSRCDPLQLVKMDGQQPTLATSPVLSEVQDWIGKQDQILGSRIYEHFREAPYGWSSEIILYVLAVLFWAGKLNLSISGHTYENRCPAVLEAMKAPNKFNGVGVSLRTNAVTPEDLVVAGGFLSTLGASGLAYTLDGINRAKNEFAEKKKLVVGDLLTKVKEAHVYGEDPLTRLAQDLLKISEFSTTEFVAFVKDPVQKGRFITDAEWLTKLMGADSKGLFAVIREVRQMMPKLKALPEEYLQQVTPSDEETEKLLQLPDFVAKNVELKQFCSSVEAVERKARSEWIKELEAKNQQLRNRVNRAVTEYDFTSEETDELEQWLRDRQVAVKEKAELVELSRYENKLTRAISNVPLKVREILHKRPVPQTKTARKICVSRRLKSAAELDQLIRQLQRFKDEIDSISEIEVTIE